MKIRLPQWPIDHDRIHLAVADGFQDRFRLSQASSHPLQFSAQASLGFVFHGSQVTPNVLRCKSSSISTLSRSDRSPTIRRKGGGERLIRVGAVTIRFAPGQSWILMNVDDFQIVFSLQVLPADGDNVQYGAA